MATQTRNCPTYADNPTINRIVTCLMENDDFVRVATALIKKRAFVGLYNENNPLGFNSGKQDDFVIANMELSNILNQYLPHTLHVCHVKDHKSVFKRNLWHNCMINCDLAKALNNALNDVCEQTYLYNFQLN